MAEVLIPAKGMQERGETATLLLAMAAEAGLEPRVVRRCNQGYLVPEELVSGVLVNTPLPLAAEEEEYPNMEQIVETVKEVRAEIVDREAARAWAKQNGYKVGDRGRVANDILAAYALAVGSGVSPLD